MSEVVDTSSITSKVRGSHTPFREKIEKLKPGKSLVFKLEEEGFRSKGSLFNTVNSWKRKGILVVRAMTLTDGQFAVAKEKNGMAARVEKTANDSVE